MSSTSIGIRLIEQIAAWLGEQCTAAGANGFVCGLSGGIDSSTAAALAVRAVGADRVLGVLMPCHSQPDDARLASLVAEVLGISTVTVDLTPAYDVLIAALPASDHPLAAANIKPRLRMLTLYYLAQSHNHLVLGSSNRSELAIGYFTKYGDGGADLLPLGGMYKTQVWELAHALGIPQEVIERPPTAGLWPGQTDEGEMGITYHDLDQTLAAMDEGDVSSVAPDVLRRVEEMVARSAHKRTMPPIFWPPDEKQQ